jgi:phosphoribosylaminoimidazole carboxylase/phosphoribosylaminoimidazole-succinocarboxamide synthase
VEKYPKGDELARGKTKTIFEVEGMPELVILENRNEITAMDDPTKTREFERKAEYCTTTTCRVFELLDSANLPVSYIQQRDETSFVAQACEMIPLEVVVRRYAFGSYLQRHPEFKDTKSHLPLRFPSLVIEFFLKTSNGKVRIQEKEIDLGLNPAKGEEDPLVANPFEEKWILFHPKHDSNTAEMLQVKRQILAKDVVENPCEMREIEKLAGRTFAILEESFEMLNCKLIDLKLEFGKEYLLNSIQLADVVDNDSWRLRDENWNELSKQVFRDKGLNSEVADKYALVAQLASKLALPAKYQSAIKPKK